MLGAEGFIASRGPNVATPRVADLAGMVGSPDSPVTRVVWLGDSTAAGVGSSTPDKSLPLQVAGLAIQDPTARRLDVVVLAESGARIDDVLVRQLPMVRVAAPDVVAISIGANDTIHGTRRPTFRARYEKLFDGLRAAGVDPAHIVVVGVPDMGAPPRLLQPLRALVGWRSRQLDLDVRHLVTRRGARYVDLFKATSKPFRQHPEKYFAADHYHPNDAGYGVWAKAIAPTVVAAL